MKKDESILTLYISLPKNFIKQLSVLQDTEIYEASKKWRINLTPEEIKWVKETSLDQLEGKVHSLTHRRLSRDSQVLEIFVYNPEGPAMELVLPSPEAEQHVIQFVRTHDRWKVDFEPTSEAIMLDEFYDYILNLLKSWLKTAVFYAVGSYQNSPESL